MRANERQNKKERLSFFINSDLSNKINKISKQNKTSVSEFARKALSYYLELIEKQKLEKELEIGYKENYNYYLKSQKDWEYIDLENSL